MSVLYIALAFLKIRANEVLAIAVMWTWLYDGLDMPLVNELLKCYLFETQKLILTGFFLKLCNIRLKIMLYSPFFWMICKELWSKAIKSRLRHDKYVVVTYFRMKTLTFKIMLAWRANLNVSYIYYMCKDVLLFFPVVCSYVAEQLPNWRHSSIHVMCGLIRKIMPLWLESHEHRDQLWKIH